LKKVTDSRRKFGSDDGNGNPNHGREAVGCFSSKKSIIDKIFVGLEGLFNFEQGIKWDAPLGLAFGGTHYGRGSREAVEVHGQRFGLGIGLGRLHTIPRRRLHLLYFIGYLFSAHFFGLSTKFGHSIPQPLECEVALRVKFSARDGKHFF
jgi:hypothetical protein